MYRMKTVHLFPKDDDDATVESGELAPLSELKDYMIEDPAPDIRGPRSRAGHPQAPGRWR
jgi:hypothetical protein